MDVRCVNGQEDAAFGVVLHLALVDAEGGQPDRIRHDDAGRAAARHQPVDLLERRIGMCLAVPGRPEIGDHPPAVADDGKEGQDAVAVPEDVKMIGGIEPGDMPVGQGPVGLQGRALEREAQPVPHRRMGAIATDQPADIERLVFPARLCEGGLDRRTLVAEAGQFDRPLDRDAGGGQPLLQHALGLALRDHQRIGEPAVDQVERDFGHDLPTGRDPGAACRHSSRQEGVGVPGIVEEFERAAPQDQRLGLVGALRRLVDDANGNSEADEFVGERQADGPGARDEHFRFVRHPTLPCPILRKLSVPSGPRPIGPCKSPVKRPYAASR